MISSMPSRHLRISSVYGEEFHYFSSFFGHHEFGELANITKLDWFATQFACFKKAMNCRSAWYSTKYPSLKCYRFAIFGKRQLEILHVRRRATAALSGSKGMNQWHHNRVDLFCPGTRAARLCCPEIEAGSSWRTSSLTGAGRQKIDQNDFVESLSQSSWTSYKKAPCWCYNIPDFLTIIKNAEF